MSQCKAVTTQGKQCKRDAVEGGYCALPAHNAMMGEPEDREIKSESKPWNSDSSRWVPDQLRLVKRKLGFRPKFTAEDKIEVRKHQGWVVSNCNDWGEEPKGNDTILRRGDLVLMEIPEEGAKEREKFYEKLTDQRSQTAKDVQSQGLSAREAREVGLTQKG